MGVAAVSFTEPRRACFAGEADVVAALYSSAVGSFSSARLRLAVSFYSCSLLLSYRLRYNHSLLNHFVCLLFLVTNAKLFSVWF